MAETRHDTSHRFGIPESEDLSRSLLYCANMAPNWLAHNEQDVTPVLPIMEEIANAIENYFAESSAPPDVKRRMSGFIKTTREHIEQLKEEGHRSDSVPQ